MKNENVLLFRTRDSFVPSNIFKADSKLPRGITAWEARGDWWIPLPPFGRRGCDKTSGNSGIPRTRANEAVRHTRFASGTVSLTCASQPIDWPSALDARDHPARSTLLAASYISLLNALSAMSAIFDFELQDAGLLHRDESEDDDVIEFGTVIPWHAVPMEFPRSKIPIHRPPSPLQYRWRLHVNAFNAASVFLLQEEGDADPCEIAKWVRERARACLAPRETTRSVFSFGAFSLRSILYCCYNENFFLLFTVRPTIPKWEA